MTTQHVTSGRNPWQVRTGLALLCLAAAGSLLLNGCDKEDNNWKALPPDGYPDLALEMVVDLGGIDTPHEGSVLRYVLTVANLGGVDAMDVVVTDTLPSAVTFAAATAGRGEYDSASGSWLVGTVAADSSATLTLTVVVAPGTRGQVVEHEARVIASEPADPVPGNDRAAASFTVASTGLFADPDSYTVDEGGTLTVAAPGVLVNDIDAAGGTFTLNDQPVTMTQHGALDLQADGSFVYVHPGNEASTDLFRYVITNANAEADTGLVTITINPVNDRPLMLPIPSQTIAEGLVFPPLSLDAYVSDDDNPDADLTWEALGATALAITIDAARVATITQPNSDWFGQEIVTFRVTDPGGLQAQRLVTFSVTPVNDPPVVGDIPSQRIVVGGSFLPFPLDEFVVDVDNPDAQLLWTFSGNGECDVSISANRIVTITPPSPGWIGQVTITFRATDPSGLWDEDAANYTVAAE